MAFIYCLSFLAWRNAISQLQNKKYCFLLEVFLLRPWKRRQVVTVWVPRLGFALAFARVSERASHDPAAARLSRFRRSRKIPNKRVCSQTRIPRCFRQSIQITRVHISLRSFYCLLTKLQLQFSYMLPARKIWTC